MPLGTTTPGVGTVTFYKDPVDVEVFSVDWTEALESGETISSCAFTLQSGITLVRSYASGKISYGWISGGTLGTLYVAEATVTTSLGLTYQKDLIIDVRYN
jgi:hypothetical protein